MRLLSGSIADFEFPREKVLRLAEQQVHGVTSLEGELVNSRMPEIAIYLRMYLRASFHRSGVQKLTRAFRVGTP